MMNKLWPPAIKDLRPFKINHSEGTHVIVMQEPFLTFCPTEVTDISMERNIVESFNEA